MNYNVTDKDGWTLAEGRIQRNREEAARIVERIDRNLRIERLIMASNKGTRTGSDTNLLDNALEKVQPKSKVVDFLHYRNRELHAPMATRRIDALNAATWLTAIGLCIGFLYGIFIWILR